MRRILSLFAYMLLILIVYKPPVAHADPLCGEIPDVAILLDRSGSMKEVVGTQSKATIARTAIQDLLSQFSGQIAFGMALLPHWPHLKDCSHAQVNTAPSTTSSNAINTLLGSIYPEGNTPIAASLQKVGAYLEANSTGSRYVILVTDAKETCLSAAAPTTQPGSCDWQQGTNFRKCSGCGWQFCLSSGNWSLDCEGNEDLFGCSYGQSCDSAGSCVGTAGAMTAQAAAQDMATKGIKTYVVGFGAAVDATALSAIAAAGGTGNYYQADNLTQLTTVLSQIAGAISCCNNGVLDAGEQCDTAITAGLPNACPQSCDDGDACTADYIDGKGCQQKCAATPITTPQNGDGCCPPGATFANDTDCADPCGNGKLDAGEKCDTAIAAGSPGACSAACDDNDPCTTDSKVGSACQQTCSASPVTKPINADGCCPAGATSVNDTDCPPEEPCGNGKLDAGEKCDTAIAVGQAGACPASCDDNDPCTTDIRHGAGCNVYCGYAPVTAPLSGDGCCLAGTSAKVDSDCPELCGNGQLDAGEKCDTKIAAGQNGSCMLNCDDGDACTRDQIIGTGCEVQCSSTPLSPNPTQPDGCCPEKNMSQTQDADCLPPCTPDRTDNCVNVCSGVKCPDGEYCADGKCLPWPDAQGDPQSDPNANAGNGVDVTSDGCACELGSNSSNLPLLGLLLGLLLWRRRRR